MSINPIEGLELQLKTVKKALEESKKKDYKETIKVEKAIVALEKKLTPLRETLRELHKKSLPFYNELFAIEDKISALKAKRIGPWDISSYEARLYNYNTKKEWYNCVVWFRGVSSDTYYGNRIWTVNISGLVEYQLPGPYTQETMIGHLASIEKECEKIGYIIVK